MFVHTGLRFVVGFYLGGFSNRSGCRGQHSGVNSPEWSWSDPEEVTGWSSLLTAKTEVSITRSASDQLVTSRHVTFDVTCNSRRRTLRHFVLFSLFSEAGGCVNRSRPARLLPAWRPYTAPASPSTACCSHQLSSPPRTCSDQSRTGTIVSTNHRTPADSSPCLATCLVTT